MGSGAGRGRKGGPTGRRTFSSVEDLKAGVSTEPRWKSRRERDGDDAPEEEEGEEEEEEEEEDEDQKAKGVSGLIEVANPNAPQKAAVKVSQANVDATSQLTRREREEIEKQRAKERYMKLQEQGKTEQAKKDLERLAAIRKQREEAAKKREEEKAAKESKKVESRKK